MGAALCVLHRHSVYRYLGVRMMKIPPLTLPFWVSAEAQVHPSIHGTTATVSGKTISQSKNTLDGIEASATILLASKCGILPSNTAADDVTNIGTATTSDVSIGGGFNLVVLGSTERLKNYTVAGLPSNRRKAGWTREADRAVDRNRTQHGT